MLGQLFVNGIRVVRMFCERYLKEEKKNENNPSGLFETALDPFEAEPTIERIWTPNMSTIETYNIREKSNE